MGRSGSRLKKYEFLIFCLKFFLNFCLRGTVYDIVNTLFSRKSKSEISNRFVSVHHPVSKSRGNGPGAWFAAESRAGRVVERTRDATVNAALRSQAKSDRRCGRSRVLFPTPPQRIGAVNFIELGTMESPVCRVKRSAFARSPVHGNCAAPTACRWTYGIDFFLVCLAVHGLGT